MIFLTSLVTQEEVSDGEGKIGDRFSLSKFHVVQGQRANLTSPADPALDEHVRYA